MNNVPVTVSGSVGVYPLSAARSQNNSKKQAVNHLCVGNRRPRLSWDGVTQIFAIAEQLFSSRFSLRGAFGRLALGKTLPNGENLPFDSLEVAQLEVCPS
jgi:hypothetical protein